MTIPLTTIQQTISTDSFSKKIKKPKKRLIRVVYDIEQLVNFHSNTFFELDTEDIKVFVIHEKRNDIVEYIAYLKSLTLMIGFNNLAYDYPMIHYILTYEQELSCLNANSINQRLYAESQHIISMKYSEVASAKVRIKQLDLFCIQGFNNPARATSLKKLQVAMRWHNVQEMPIHYTTMVVNSQVDLILEYNLNDVMSTKAFLAYCLDKINVRLELTKYYKTDLMNANDIKMGSEIFASELSKKLGTTSFALKRNIISYDELIIDFDRIILPYIKYSIKPFNCILEYFRHQRVKADSIKGFFTKIPINSIYKIVPSIKPFINTNAINKKTKVLKHLSVIYDEREYVFGAGGLHMSAPAGIYVADEEYDIWDIDVKSYYPNLSIRNRFYPKHLTEAFCDVYEELYDKRISFQQIMKLEPTTIRGLAAKLIQEGIKLSLNSVLIKCRFA